MSFARGERPIVRDLTTTIMRGDRVGLIGPNGSGKTTLLRLLLGELPPDSGHGPPGHGPRDRVLRPAARAARSRTRRCSTASPMAPTSWRSAAARKHVLGYLQDFLFPPERARTPVGALSGGERNRLLLARLFTRRSTCWCSTSRRTTSTSRRSTCSRSCCSSSAARCCVVSHDRAFLDNVVTSTLVFEGGGTRRRVRRRLRRLGAPAARPDRAGRAPALKACRRDSGPREQRQEKAPQLQGVEGTRGTASGNRRREQERERLYASLSDPAFLRDGLAVAAAKSRLTAVTDEIATLTERWETLETMASEVG